MGDNAKARPNNIQSDPMSTCHYVKIRSIIILQVLVVLQSKRVSRIT